MFGKLFTIVEAYLHAPIRDPTIQPSFLLKGSAGTGKTYLMRSVAACAGLNFLQVREIAVPYWHLLIFF